MVCGMHIASLASGTLLQEGGAQTPSSPPTVSSFSLFSPLPSPSYSLFCTLRSLSLHDVAFDGGRFFWVTWHGWLLLVVGDVADVVHPHPLMRGGAVVTMWQTWGLSKGSDMAMVGDGDVAWLVGVSLSDEHALT